MIGHLPEVAFNGRGLYGEFDLQRHILVLGLSADGDHGAGGPVQRGRGSTPERGGALPLVDRGRLIRHGDRGGRRLDRPDWVRVGRRISPSPALGPTLLRHPGVGSAPGAERYDAQRLFLGDRQCHSASLGYDRRQSGQHRCGLRAYLWQVGCPQAGRRRGGLGFPYWAMRRRWPLGFFCCYAATAPICGSGLQGCGTYAR